MLDKSLDYAWRLSSGRNRKNPKITIDKDEDEDEDEDTYMDRYTNIINDKLNIVNEIGELINNYISVAYNIVDGINKSHNNSPLYVILTEDLENCKDSILKIINSSYVYVKQDTKKNDADNASVCDKQDTNNDKPDTKVKDKPHTKVKDTRKKDTKKKDTRKKDSKPDTKVKDKSGTKVKDNLILIKKISLILKSKISLILKLKIKRILKNPEVNRQHLKTSPKNLLVKVNPQKH